MGQCHAKNYDDCPICLTKMCKNQDLIHTKCCYTQVHDECIRKWAFENPTCPFCRSSFKINLKPESMAKLNQYLNNYLLMNDNELSLQNNNQLEINNNTSLQRIQFYNNNNDLITETNINNPNSTLNLETHYTTIET